MNIKKSIGYSKATGIVRLIRGVMLAVTIASLPTVAIAQTAADSYYLAAAAAAQSNQGANANGADSSPQQNANQTAANSNGNAAINQQIEPVSISGSAAGGQAGAADGERSTMSGMPAAIPLSPAPKLANPPMPNDYEAWIAQVTGRKLKRFGSSLLLPSERDFAVPATATIPPDYALNVGDTVSIALSGSVEGSANFEINRDGQIYLPHIGNVSVVGVRYHDLKERVAAAIGQKYRGYDVSVSIAKLRGIRVYVTGFANSPGAYTVNSLSTLANAVLAAGGPSAGGSFRSVKLYRNGHEITDFDLYTLLRKGDRTHDPLLQNEDVLLIPPVGQQVAVFGSVNEPAIYEAKAGETLDSVLAYAGGATNLAEENRLVLYRLSDRDTVGSREIQRDQARLEQVMSGDIIQVLPQGSLARPLERQQVVVRLEGEVNKPGNYYVQPGTPLSRVVEMAGGLTSRAYVFGTSFQRESVRAQQRQGFFDAIEQMETVISVTPSTSTPGADAGDRQSQLSAARAFLQQLRQKEPDGRLVISTTPDSNALPGDILLENNDRIIVPPKVSTVSVFGAVYRPATFMLDDHQPQRVEDYIEEAGGAIRGADKGNAFVVRMNGSVLTRRHGAMNARVLPGDTIFVPIRVQPSSIWNKIRDISTILFQFGVTAAAIASIS